MWHRTSAVVALLVGAVVASACTSPAAPGPVAGGLAVDSTSPVGNATDAPFVGPAYIYFDRALDPLSVSTATAGILLPGDLSTPGRATYDAQRRAIRLDMALIPGVTFTGIATTNVRGNGGESLSANHVWTFQTRAPATAAIDPGADRGASPVVVTDGAGVVHTAYTDNTAGTVHYGRCAASCTTAGNWTTTSVTTGTVAGSRIDLVASPAGELAIAHYRAVDGALVVSVCAAGCAAAAGWQSVVVDDATGDVGFSPSIARGSDGALHVIAQDRGATAIRYARCQAACDAAANWSAAVQLGGGNGIEGRVSDLIVSGTGTLHAAWVDDDGSFLVYASCVSNCAAPASWTVASLTGTVDTADRLGMTLDAAGRPVILFGIDDFVAVGLCISMVCTDQISWSFLGLLLDGGPTTGLSIATDADGRFHAAFATETGTVRYLSCTSLCETASSRWVAGGLAGSVSAIDASIGLAPNGEPVSVYRRTGQGLAFLR